VTPRHEIAGKIESIGEEAENLFAKGGKVLVYPWIGDGIGPACRIGEV
jgi:alcohol dehydrogenase, propanol-preferring